MPTSVRAPASRCWVPTESARAMHAAMGSRRALGLHVHTCNFVLHAELFDFGAQRFVLGVLGRHHQCVEILVKSKLAVNLSLRILSREHAQGRHTKNCNKQEKRRGENQ